MAPNAIPPVLATPADWNFDQAGASIFSINSHSVRELQAARLRDHWKHISLPLAKVLADLVYDTGGRQ
jgi:hypothetical protein